MRSIRFVVGMTALLALAAFGPASLSVPLGPTIVTARDSDSSGDGRRLVQRFVVDVALDGRTWRLNDGTNPFYPTFTGALSRGQTFIVSGRIYRGFTLREGGDLNLSDNPAGPETPNPIGTWVCRGAFNLDIAEIAAGQAPHVTSTQVFYFDDGNTIFSEGPEGGATVLRAIIGGTGRFNDAAGEVSEKPLGVNTTNLFNVRFHFVVR